MQKRKQKRHRKKNYEKKEKKDGRKQGKVKKTQAVKKKSIVPFTQTKEGLEENFCDNLSGLAISLAS